MYSSYEDAESAKKIFNLSENLDQISWNSMLSGYMKCGQNEDAKLHNVPKQDQRGYYITWASKLSQSRKNPFLFFSAPPLLLHRALRCNL